MNIHQELRYENKLHCHGFGLFSFEKLAVSYSELGTRNSKKENPFVCIKQRIHHILYADVNPSGFWNQPRKAEEICCERKGRGRVLLPLRSELTFSRAKFESRLMSYRIKTNSRVQIQVRVSNLKAMWT